MPPAELRELRGQLATFDVVACTLLPYEPEFTMGRSLAEAADEVWLNPPRCARFCVLGAGSCAPGS